MSKQPNVITLTLNPAVDLAASANAVQPTHKIRTRDEGIDAGGGGINVARVIHALGGNTLAVFLAGGVTGDLLGELLAEAGVPRRVLPIQRRTRISLTVYDRSTGQEYRFVPEGPEVSTAEWQGVLATLEQLPGDWLVVSGSLPRGVPEDLYARIAQAGAQRGQRVVLDTSGPALKAALYHGLYLIKPSLRELEVLVGRSLEDPAAQEAEALALIRSGAAHMVAVSLGAAGALLATEAGMIRIPAPHTLVRSGVGAGDAFLAALVLTLARGETPAKALRWGVAAGAATVSDVGTARISSETVEAQYHRLATVATISQR